MDVLATLHAQPCSRPKMSEMSGPWMTRRTVPAGRHAAGLVITGRLRSACARGVGVSEDFQPSDAIAPNPDVTDMVR